MGDLEGAVIAALEFEAPGALIEPLGQCPQSNIDRDLDLLDAVLRGEHQSGLVRIWRNPCTVVVSKRLAMRPGFAGAEARLAPTGAAVAVRASGGTGVLHRPGIINVSLFCIDHGPSPMHLAYTELTSLFCRALARLGVEAEAGRAAGAYCDGDHNVLWQGRKLAGTAAVVRRRAGLNGRLVHGSLVVSGDVQDDIRLIRLAEAGLLPGMGYTHLSHATVAEALLQKGARRPRSRKSSFSTRPPPHRM